MRKTPLADRFWAKVNKTGTCGLWTAYIEPNGYGVILGDGKKLNKAHRVSYELAYGPIPDGLVIDHLCRNRACVNPAHLEATTHRVNILRGINLASQNIVKTHCVNGHPLSGGNLSTTKDGHRVCLECAREANRKCYAKYIDKYRQKHQDYYLKTRKLKGGDR